MKHLILILALLFAPSLVKAQACTDGVDCLCDRLCGQGLRENCDDPTIKFCEDYEDESWNDGTGALFGASSYSNPGSPTICPNDPVSGVADEGTDADDGYNFVQDGAGCDSAGTTDCAFEDQAFGFAYSEGYHFGICAEHAINDTGPTFGVTLLVKFSKEFQRLGSPGLKWLQFVDGANHSLLGGQDGVLSDYTFTPGYAQIGGQDNKCLMGAGQSGYLDTQSDPFGDPDNNFGQTGFNDLLWTRTLYTAGSPDMRNADCDVGGAFPHPAGRIYQSNNNQINIAPDVSAFPGGAFNWPTDEWVCLRVKYTGFGTSTTGRIETWWQQELANPAVETKIIDFTNVDLSLLDGNNGIDRVYWDGYFNGLDSAGATGGQTTGVCGYGATGAPGGSCTYAGLDRAYRYEDNLVITSGDPVTCAQVGFAFVPDTTPPIITDQTAPGPLGASTTNHLIEIWTGTIAGFQDEYSVCKYKVASSPDLCPTDIDDVTLLDFDQPAGEVHSKLIEGLTPGSSFSYCATCESVGGLSTYEYMAFSVEATVDTELPVVYDISPSGFLLIGTTSTNLIFYTTKPSDCRRWNNGVDPTGSPPYSTAGYTQVNEIGGLVFQEFLTGLTAGDYDYTIICQDRSAGLNESIKYHAIFTINGATDTLAPVRTVPLPTAPRSYTQTTAIVRLQTGEEATCRYSLKPGVAYADMSASRQFWGSGYSAAYKREHHITIIKNLTAGLQRFYPRCIDPTGNVDETDWPIQFMLTGPPVGASGAYSMGTSP